MKLVTKTNGHDLSPGDFGRDAAGYVAWVMASRASVLEIDRADAVASWRLLAETVLDGSLAADARDRALRLIASREGRG